MNRQRVYELGGAASGSIGSPMKWSLGLFSSLEKARKALAKQPILDNIEYKIWRRVIQ